MQILVINCGSSSVKYRLTNPQSGDILVGGKLERVGQELTHEQALEQVIQACADHTIEAVGHRVVHGGDRYVEAVAIDPSVLEEIEARSVDAPLHNPYNLAGIKLAQAAWPDVCHVAVFDTAFHARLPRRAKSYAISPALAEQYRIKRFGFHGTSHQYVAQVAANALGRDIDDLRMVTLHLGNGASAAAVEFGKSTETSMGMTPLEGLVMGTRAGDIDAGAVLTLLRSGDYDVEQVDQLLNKDSGLAGLSSRGNDLREIEKYAAEGDDNCRLAINVFAHRVRKYIGAYAAAMGGLDAVVFTGGIGQNSVTMRRRILQRLEFLGLSIDEDLNADVALNANRKSTLISAPGSRVSALVVKTDEELMIARQARIIARGDHLRSARRKIPIAVSARHLHLTAETFAKLFGADATPTQYKDIYQPGQFACVEKVNLVGPRNRIDGVRVLGPLRSVDQVEVARTDEYRLGVDAPIRDSGKIEGSAPITLEGPAGTVHLQQGLICARRHIHMHPDDAREFEVEDRDIVEVTIAGGPRDLAFGDVLVRVSEKYKLEMHIDTDEANAAELNSGAGGELVYQTADNASALLRSSKSLK